MLPALLLSLREGLEAALIIGIVLGALRKLHRPDLAAPFWLGAGSAFALSLLTAILLTRLGLELKDPGEAIFEGLTMLLAALLLTWMIFWMSRQSTGLKATLESGVRQASLGGKGSIFGLAFLSVLREGVELALFLTAATFASQAHLTLLGALLGLGAAALLGWLLFASTLRLDLRRFFRVTGTLLILFAAGLLAIGVGELVEVGWIPALVEHLWDTGNLLAEASPVGQLLKALFGYSQSPSLMQVLVYAAYSGAVLLGLWLMRRINEPASSQA